MAEWLYEAGIGEERAILVEDGEIVEAAILLPGTLTAGAVVEARLTAILVPGRRGIVTFGDGCEALLEPLPAQITEGQTLSVEITRAAVPEVGKAKRPRCRSTDAPLRASPDLKSRLGGSGLTVRQPGPHEPDRFEEAGWSELLDEAATGEVSFPGGALRMSLTPAMTLFDVDGTLDPAALAVAGAAAVARSVRRFDLGGSIGIDLPTLARRDDRQAAAAAVDAILPQPFERTAVNGFGFLQIVRRKERPSIPEILQADPVRAAARTLLRRAERSGGAGPRTLVAAPAVTAWIERNPAWLDSLARKLGTPVGLRADPSLAISAGHVHSAFA